VTGTAKFGGKNEEYRYPLSRISDVNKPHALFVLMNPSTANCSSDDSPDANCQVFAKGWGGLRRYLRRQYIRSSGDKAEAPDRNQRPRWPRQ
jgi:hypothetical protein